MEVLTLIFGLTRRMSKVESVRLMHDFGHVHATYGRTYNLATWMLRETTPGPSNAKP